MFGEVPLEDKVNFYHICVSSAEVKVIQPLKILNLSKFPFSHILKYLSLKIG